MAPPLTVTAMQIFGLSQADQWDASCNKLLSSEAAAALLGVTRETLRAWRRRGIGPAYTRLPGGHVRHGKTFWHAKQHGRIAYRLSDLDAYIQRQTVQAGRLPRPFAGRLPAGGERSGA